jgi:formylglycine-generating enzyme required for sulfatase activity
VSAFLLSKAPAPKATIPAKVTNSIGMKLVRIPAGKFIMGSPLAETGRSDDEQQHGVKISQVLSMGVYPVTQEEYQKVTKVNPSFFSAGGKGKDDVAGKDTSKFPVENVSWHDAVKFCSALSALPAEKAAGRRYRLPTEAEWEYACRAGTTTKYHSGGDEDDLKVVGWYLTNGSYGTQEVGQKQSNAWGLFDMHGNVYQWCSDWYGKGYYGEGDKTDPEGPKKSNNRVLRGGFWYGSAESCRAAARLGLPPRISRSWIGFRVVCVAQGAR